MGRTSLSIVAIWFNCKTKQKKLLLKKKCNFFLNVEILTHNWCSCSAWVSSFSSSQGRSAWNQEGFTFRGTRLGKKEKAILLWSLIKLWIKRIWKYYKIEQQLAKIKLIKQYKAVKTWKIMLMAHKVGLSERHWWVYKLESQIFTSRKYSVQS